MTGAETRQNSSEHTYSLEERCCRKYRGKDFYNSVQFCEINDSAFVI